MQKTIFECDICEREIADEPIFKVKAHEPTTGKDHWKKIGCDMVLTPRGDRFYVGQAMLRINASFYCGVNPGEVDEFHFHPKCIEREIHRRLLPFLLEETSDA